MLIVILHHGHWDKVSWTLKTVLNRLQSIIQLPSQLINQRTLIPLIGISNINMLKLPNILNAAITRHPHPVPNSLSHTKKVRLLRALINEQAFRAVSSEIDWDSVKAYPDCYTLPDSYHQVVWQALLEEEVALTDCRYQWGVANVFNEWVCSRVLTIREDL